MERMNPNSSSPEKSGKDPDPETSDLETLGLFASQIDRRSRCSREIPDSACGEADPEEVKRKRPSSEKKI